MTISTGRYLEIFYDLKGKSEKFNNKKKQELSEDLTVALL